MDQPAGFRPINLTPRVFPLNLGPLPPHAANDEPAPQPDSKEQ